MKPTRAIGSNPKSTHGMLELVPDPKRVERSGGAFPLTPLPDVQSRVPDERISRAVARLSESLSRDSRRRGDQSRRPGRILVSVDHGQVAHPQGYHLTVTPEVILLAGGSPAGCFYGLQTLRQLVTSKLSDLARPEIPCCTIMDAPDLETRGLLHDVTRGKVPTLQTLKLLADRLALLKANQLQLYIEHAFAYSFDPDICPPNAGLAPDDITELDAYCRERFIDLVPAVATLGHMGRILSMPKYRHLAEVEAKREWSQMTWPERVRGLTLDCMNPEAFRLVERMWHDVMDAFSSPVVNICGDEPWDLGRGRNQLSTTERGQAYAAHLIRTHDLCARRGRRVQCWSDVLANHPDQLGKLPRDLTVLHWGYDDTADYEGTAAFVRHGLNTFVCPGTSGWKRVINAINLAERNIATFAKAAQRHGAKGLVNTDWGDHGHFNALACSWHGIATGAALGWRGDHPLGEVLDKTVASVLVGMGDAEGFSLLRRATRAANGADTWRQLWSPLQDVAADETLPSVDCAQISGDLAAAAERLFRAHDRNQGNAADLAELEVACRFQQLWAQKIGFAHEHRSRGPATSESAKARREWCEPLAEAGAAFAERWVQRNKASGLDEILKTLETVSAELVVGGPSPSGSGAGAACARQRSAW